MSTATNGTNGTHVKRFLVEFHEADSTRWVEHDLSLEHHLEVLGASLAKVCSRGPIPQVTAKFLPAGPATAERIDATEVQKAPTGAHTNSEGLAATSLPTPTTARRFHSQKNASGGAL